MNSIDVIDICLLLFSLSFVVPFIYTRLTKAKINPTETELEVIREAIAFIKTMITLLIGLKAGEALI